VCALAVGSADRDKLKREILELLESDEEFRYAVAGFLGLDAVLNELKKMRDDFQTFVKLQEKRWEENEERWRANEERWVKNEKLWNEAFKRFEAIERTLLEHGEKLKTLDRRVSRLELEVGALTEATLAKFTYEELEENARERGEKIFARRRNASVNGFEIDLLVETDKTVYAVEIKIKPKRRHVDELLAKAEAVQKISAKPVKPILAGAYISAGVERYAKSKGAEVIRY